MNETFHLNAEQLYLFVYVVFLTALNNVCQLGFNRMIKILEFVCQKYLLSMQCNKV